MMEAVKSMLSEGPVTFPAPATAPPPAPEFAPTLESEALKLLVQSENWDDCTKDFFAYSGELRLGELLHDSLFGLFEAMSAIEMMDPKMDAGMMCNRGSKRPLNFDQAVKMNQLKLQDLSLQEQIGIFDTTMACLVTWLEGHSLAQTVFTNLYLHKPSLVEDRCTKAVSIAVLKLVEIIRDFISRALVFEEEDFQLITYGFKLACDVTQIRTLGMLREVEEDIQRKVKSTRIRQGEDWEAEMQKQHHESVALFSRVRFLRMLLQALIAFAKKESSGLEETEKCLAVCAELLPSFHKTLELGSQPEERCGDNFSRGDYPTIMGFEPLVNQRLLPPTFPRYTKLKTRDEAYGYLEGLVLRLRASCKVAECTGFQATLDFFTDFSKGCPCVLSRSFLQLLYLPHNAKVMGSQPVVDVLRESLRHFIAPPSLVPKSPLMSNPQAKETIDAFLSHCVRPFCGLVQLCGFNRARQRERMAALLEDLAALQDEADKVDSFLHSLSLKSEPGRAHMGCFSTWILYHTVRLMIQYLLSGFELELYSTHEYHYVYWYLYEFLYGWATSVLSRADGYLLEQETLSEQQKARNAKKANKKKKKARPHGREIVLNQAQQSLCGGYYKAVVGLRLQDKMRLPAIEFDNEQVRYEHRFAAFQAVLTPPLAHYVQFREMSDMTRGGLLPPPPAADVFASAAQNFGQAKCLLEGITPPGEEVLSLIKVAKMNMIVMNLLAKGHRSESKDPPEFDFSVNKVFPVIKVP